MNIQSIPLTKLVPSPANERTVKTGIEGLAASIAAHGLLQNLQVRLGNGGSFEVVAGGRRLAALKWLAKQKKIAGDFPVPCEVCDGAALLVGSEVVHRIQHGLSRWGRQRDRANGRFDRVSRQPGCRPPACGLALDRTLVRRGDTWWVQIPASETKTKASIELAHLEAYLADYRAGIVALRSACSNASGDALWLSMYGVPMTDNGIYTRIVARTREGLGRPIMSASPPVCSVIAADPRLNAITTRRAALKRAA